MLESNARPFTMDAHTWVIVALFVFALVMAACLHVLMRRTIVRLVVEQTLFTLREMARWERNRFMHFSAMFANGIGVVWAEGVVINIHHFCLPHPELGITRADEIVVSIDNRANDSACSRWYSLYDPQLIKTLAEIVSANQIVQPLTTQEILQNLYTTHDRRAAGRLMGRIK